MKVERSLWIALTVAALGFSASIAAQTPAAEQQKPKLVVKPARNIQSVEGKDAYAAYCAACHGKAAKGDGPAVPALKVPPPDLTLLARNSGGKFASVEVEQMIAGTGRSMAAHGSSDMPIWGHIFFSMGNNQDLATMRTKNLVKYLESLQVK